MAHTAANRALPVHISRGSTMSQETRARGATVPNELQLVCGESLGIRHGEGVDLLLQFGQGLGGPALSASAGRR